MKTHKRVKPYFTDVLPVMTVKGHAEKYLISDDMWCIFLKLKKILIKGNTTCILHQKFILNIVNEEDGNSEMKCRWGGGGGGGFGWNT